MPKPHHDRRHDQKRDHHGNNGSEGNEHEPYDDPEEHLEIERDRFKGGLQPTPELYARAREQWRRLPGSLVRPPMDPPIPEPEPEQKRGK